MTTVAMAPEVHTVLRATADRGDQTGRCQSGPIRSAVAASVQALQADALDGTVRPWHLAALRRGGHAAFPLRARCGDRWRAGNTAHRKGRQRCGDRRMTGVALIGVPFDGYGRPGNQAGAAAALGGPVRQWRQPYPAVGEGAVLGPHASGAA